jgi:hypothetical protein
MASGIYSWSQTDASNNSADSTINWAEGQGPGSVNNSARALMGRLADWRDDLAGVKPSNAEMVTGGSSSAMTLTTNATIDPAALTHGWMVCFQSGFTCAAACTLAVDSLTAKTIQRVAGTSVVAGDIVAGGYYTVHYNQPDDAWILHSPIILPSNDIATTAQVRGNTASKLIETDNLWGAAETVALTDASSVAVDMSSGWNFTLSIGGNRTLANPSSAKVGQSGFIRVTATGSTRTLDKGSGWLSTETFPLSINASAVKYIFYTVYTTAPIVIITGILTDPS